MKIIIIKIIKKNTNKTIAIITIIHVLKNRLKVKTAPSLDTSNNHDQIN
jgi:hypothetical protein